MIEFKAGDVIIGDGKYIGLVIDIKLNDEYQIYYFDKKKIYRVIVDRLIAHNYRLL